MQRLARKGRNGGDGCGANCFFRQFAFAAIGRIANQPMARMRHMHPDLMGTSGFQPTFHKGGHRRGAKGFQRARTGHGMAAHPFKKHGLALTVGFMAGKIGRDAQDIAGLKRAATDPAQAWIGGIRRTIDHGKVAAVDGVCLKLRGKPVMGAVRFATTSKPLVSLSMRCTIPGRFSPPTPDRLPPKWYKSALTSVPVHDPGAGCTTMPVGLLITIRSASSHKISSAISSASVSTSALGSSVSV